MSTMKSVVSNTGPYLGVCFYHYIFDAAFLTGYLNYSSEVPNQKSEMCLFARIQVKDYPEIKDLE